MVVVDFLVRWWSVDEESRGRFLVGGLEAAPLIRPVVRWYVDCSFFIVLSFAYQGHALFHSL